MKAGFYWYVPSAVDEGDWQETQVVEVDENGAVYLTGSDQTYDIEQSRGALIGPLDPPEDLQTFGTGDDTTASEKTEQDFLEWLSGADLSIGYCRYGQLGGHGFLCATNYDDGGITAELVDSLDAGDVEALEAAQQLKENGCWHGNDPDPSKAMDKMLEKMRAYFFEELNG